MKIEDLCKIYWEFSIGSSGPDDHRVICPKVFISKHLYISVTSPRGVSLFDSSIENSMGEWIDIYATKSRIHKSIIENFTLSESEVIDFTFNCEVRRK